jgi:hypothetical protein
VLWVLLAGVVMWCLAVRCLVMRMLLVALDKVCDERQGYYCYLQVERSLPFFYTTKEEQKDTMLVQLNSPTKTNRHNKMSFCPATNWPTSRN